MNQAAGAAKEIPPMPGAGTPVTRGAGEGPESRVPVAVWLLGLGLWACCGFFLFVVPLTPARMARRSADLIPQLPLWELVATNPLPTAVSPVALAWLLALFGGGAFLFYAAAIFMVWDRRPSARNLAGVFGASMLFCATATVALPTQNTDIFNYIMQGRVSAVHGANPYLAAPNEFADDPLLGYASAQYTDTPNDYLPAWSLYNRSISRLATDDPVRSLLVYRSGFGILLVGNLLLVLAILTRVSPQHRLAGLITFGWNPIVVLEGQSRVDTLMVFLLLVALLLIVHRKHALAGAALTLSVLTKWITLPLLLCFAAGRVWARQWRLLGLIALASAAAALLAYLPFLETFEVVRLHFEMLMRGGSSAPDGVRPFLGAGLVVLAVWLGRFRDSGYEIAIWSWAALLIYFAAFLTKIGFAWYMIVPAAVVALVRDRRIAAVFVCLCLAAFAFQVRDSAFNRVFPLHELIEVDRFFVFVALALAGTLLLTVVQMARRHWKDGLGSPT